MRDDENYPPGTPEREVSIRRRVHRIAEFYQHLMMYVGVISLLWLVNAITVYHSTGNIKWSLWWALWPTLGWGIGVAVHGLTVLPVWGFFSLDWEERKVKEIMERERRK